MSVTGQERNASRIPWDSSVDAYEQALEEAWMRVSRTETRFAEFGGEICELAMDSARQHLAAVLRRRGGSLGRVTWVANGRVQRSHVMEIGFGQLLVRHLVTRNEVWISADQVLS